MTVKKHIVLKLLEHKNRKFIGVYFEGPEAVQRKIIDFPGMQVSPRSGLHFINYHREQPSVLSRYFKHKGFSVDCSAFERLTSNFSKIQKSAQTRPDMHRMHQMLPLELKDCLRGYTGFLKGKRLSKSTVRTYGFFVLRFLHFVRSTPLTDLKKSDLDLFFERVMAREGYSISSHRQCVSALKYLLDYCDLPHLESTPLTRPRKSKKLPVVLSKEEIIDLMQVTRNLKHRAIIGMIYSCGLRIGELLELKLTALDFDRNILRIEQSKGRKDRTVMMSLALRPLVHNYLNTYRPKVYFAEGQNGGPYSAESVRRFLKTNCQRAGIRKRVTPHVLRHSYATHLLENGIDVRYIQELLGHAKPETTMIYTHVAQKDLRKIDNPLDLTVEALTQTPKQGENILLSRNRNH